MELIILLAMAALGSVGSTAGAGAILFLGVRSASVVPYLVSFATGTLLAGACLGLLQKALQRSEPSEVTVTLLAGLLGFFLLERLLIWRHCHNPDCDVHRAKGYMILVGDGIHNFMDGVAIGASFAVSIPLGVTTSLAVAAHEAPQEIGDFGILLNSGFKKKAAFWMNLASSSVTIPGAVVAYLAFSAIEGILGLVLALAASSFLYIALADLVPELHGETSLRRSLPQFGLTGLGVILIWMIKLVT